MQFKVAAGSLALLLLSGLAGCRTSSTSLQPGETQARRGNAEAYSLYVSGRYRDAERVYERSYQLALARGDTEAAFLCLNGVGGARFAMFQYREAMQAYLEARRLAQKTGKAEMLAAVHTNLSSLYLQQQEVNAGARAADEALQALSGAGPTRFGALLRAQSAILHSRQGNLEAALLLFGEALEEAAARGNLTTLSLIWDQLGYELLTRGRLEDAERALLEGFRIRKLNRLPDLQYSYYTLGMLRLAQGDPATARFLLDESLARLSKAPLTLALWRVYYERGRAESGMGKFEEALSDFRQAVEYARRVRLEVLPADSVWINTGVDQDRLYSALIRAAATLYSQTGDAAHARLGFEAAEENRAAGLRALIFSPDEWRRRLPPDYWEVLARLRAMESKLLQGDDSAVRDEMSQFQYRLTEMEAEAGLTLFPPGLPGSGVAPELLQRVHAAVEDGEAYFSFYLAEPESFLWVVTRRKFRMFHLAGRRHLAPLVSQFLAAVKQDLPEHVRLGQELYGALFSAVPADLAALPRWSLALEGELYEVPMAALVVRAPRAAPEYLAERHVIRLVPSALLLERRSRTVWDKPFVGVGDPIYNAADDRLPSGRRRGLRRAGEYLAILPRVFAGANFNGGAELARLAGSGGEISACARAWDPEAGGSVLLTGPEASLKGLDRALMTGAAVLHFATHFLPSAASTRQAMIALSLDAQGAPELLGPAEISRRRLDLGLAVLSGCASASAEAPPAEGLMGMTRAWLGAGARSVLATLWPTPDDQGRLLVSFYTHLARLRDRGDGWVVAEALRSAQLDALRSGAAYGPPAYWGAYILAGRE